MFLAKLLLNPTIVSRADWGARDVVEVVPPQGKEVTHLVVSFTETPPCDSKELCKLRMQQVQDHHIGVQKKKDIQYNFLVGGDGNVYEGRGWSKAPTYPKNNKDLKELNGNAFEVAFIGPSNKKPSMKSMKAFAGLILKAIDQKVISRDYTKVKPCIVTKDGVTFFNKDAVNEEALKNKSVKALMAEYNKLQ